MEFTLGGSRTRLAGPLVKIHRRTDGKKRGKGMEKKKNKRKIRMENYLGDEKRKRREKGREDSCSRGF